jgi:hypothetical protein
MLNNVLPPGEGARGIRRLSRRYIRPQSDGVDRPPRDREEYKPAFEDMMRL